MLSYAERIAEQEQQPIEVLRQLGPSGLKQLSKSSLPTPMHMSFRSGPLPIPAGVMLDALNLRYRTAI